MLPFSAEQFLDVFRRYNVGVWPAQWVLLAIGGIIVVLALRNRPNADRWASALLALLWLWMAVAYHFAFFASINPAAVAFAAGFAVQTVVFARLALRVRVTPRTPPTPVATVVGSLIVAYALVGYPAIGFLVGHRYPATPTFGVPCPTTIFTLGILVWLRPSTPWWALVVPIAWAGVGTSAAFALGMTEDVGLPIAAVMTLAVFVASRAFPDMVSAAPRRRPAPDSTAFR